MTGTPGSSGRDAHTAASIRVNVPIHLVLLKALADAPREWVDDADLFVKYTAWLASIGGNRV